MTLKNLGLSTRIIALAIISFVAIVVVNNIVFVKGYEESALNAMMEKAAAFTAVADAAKNHQSHLLSVDAVDTDKMLGEALDLIDNGADYTDTEYFNTIPVVVGWTAAGEAAQKENINFRVSAFNARNRDNTVKLTRMVLIESS